MQEWLSHMETIHSDEWNRKIHMSTWYCDVDHDEVVQFKDHPDFVSHMKVVTNHPKRPPPTDLQVDALSRNKQILILREEEYCCPLCDCVPDSIEPVIRTGNFRSDDVKAQLNKHIADHVKTLAFISLPIPAQKTASDSNFEDEDRRRLRRDCSAAEHLSGYDSDIRAISLSFIEDPQSPDPDINEDDFSKISITRELYLDDSFNDYMMDKMHEVFAEEDPLLAHFARLQHPIVIPETNKKLSHNDYMVGWICPLAVEQIAAMEMLDEEHERLPQPATDHNVYNLGSIAGHNVVIAGLHQPTNNPAATVVTQMRMTFPNLRFGMLVGIGGGVPVKTNNGMIQLGDIVVSTPVEGHSGTIQYDYGKAKVGQFERTGALAPPPAVLLGAAQDLAAERARSRKDPIKDNIKRVDISIQGLRKYKHPGAAQDYLYKPDYIHLKAGMSCDECGCDPSQRIQQLADDEDDEPYIIVHRGTIASGELVVKDAILRDQLAKEYSLLCFEREAAGTLDDFPCIVIRGISDYCDSHKNDQWHEYAAAAAAAYARQLFFHIPINEVKRYVLASNS